MNGRFNIIIAVTYRINCVLEAMLESMFSQVTKTKSIFCNIFDFDRIKAIIKRVKGRIYNMLLSKTLQLSHLRRLESNLFHAIVAEGKKEFLKKIVLGFKMRIFIRISEGVMLANCGNCII